MRLVVDTNVILKALIKDSVVRGMLLRSSHEFLTPEHAIQETRKHLDIVAEKSGLAEEEIASVLGVLLSKVEVVPAGRMAPKLKEAERLIGRVDVGDVPFVAAALSVRCDGIWSDDRHLKRQAKVRVWTTKEVAGLGGK